MNEAESEELRDIILEETRRGTKTRVPSHESLARRRLLLADMHELLRIRDRRALERVLIEQYELLKGSQQLDQVLKIWSKFSRGPRRS